MLNCKMEISFLFNRDVDKKKDIVSPGGYEIKVGDKSYSFDFEDYNGGVDTNNPKRCSFVSYNPDYESFPDLNRMTVSDLKNITELSEVFVFTGEINETQLELAMLESISFYIYDEEEEVKVSDDVIAEFNEKLDKYKDDYHEELFKILIDRIRNGQQSFISDLKKQGIDTVIDNAGDISAYENLLFVLENTSFDMFDKFALVNWLYKSGDNIGRQMVDNLTYLDHSGENEAIVEMINKQRGER